MGSRLPRFHQLRRESAQEWPPGGLRTLSHDPQAHRWLLEWSDDSGDPDHDIRAIADTVEEARAAIDRRTDACKFDIQCRIRDGRFIRHYRAFQRMIPPRNGAVSKPATGSRHGGQHLD